MRRTDEEPRGAMRPDTRPRNNSEVRRATRGQGAARPDVRRVWPRGGVWRRRRRGSGHDGGGARGGVNGDDGGGADDDEGGRGAE
ncbi:hypothetical protein GUJ93_ZPchr0006g44895 [Zizania palustris]|uniref:Uncharacterized protein n=1 Tax=Zizania palustris TaxID=103762 RepID=A0A8J5TG24_ZIZPA|nr:hypothetical protein GUJ93_ZPchr0006g44895 [Zizania palustris]